MIFSMYKDAKKEWRWRFIADNQKIIADSAEGYKNRQDCINAIKLIQSNAATTPIYDIDATPVILVN